MHKIRLEVSFTYVSASKLKYLSIIFENVTAKLQRIDLKIPQQLVTLVYNLLSLRLLREIMISFWHTVHIDPCSAAISEVIGKENMELVPNSGLLMRDACWGHRVSFLWRRCHSLLFFTNYFKYSLLDIMMNWEQVLHDTCSQP